jgi:mannose-6-phosphate isomerase
VSARPIVLRGDNFTPRARTPWGGTRLREHYKSGLDLPVGDAVVGESWELSVEPSFPSRDHAGVALSEHLAADPKGWLGRYSEALGGQSPLLVKLLDAAANLSVQVHPSADDPTLAADESGKPEAWVVLEAEAGAGLYLGFHDGVHESHVRQCIEDGGALDALMNFVPVSPDDVFVIEAGTPHAIGAGLTLLEPQFVLPGRRGLTYRYWDWNRRYAADGTRDPAGRGRELHLERSLAVTSWQAPRGEDFVNTCRARRCELMARDGLRHERLVDWRWFQVERIAGNGSLELNYDGLAGLTCVAGQAALTSKLGDIAIRRGETAAIPAAAGPFELKVQGAILYVTTLG